MRKCLSQINAGSGGVRQLVVYVETRPCHAAANGMLPCLQRPYDACSGNAAPRSDGGAAHF